MPKFNSLLEYRIEMFRAHANYALVKFINPLWQALSEGGFLDKLCIFDHRLIIIVDGRPSSFAEVFRFEFFAHVGV